MDVILLERVSKLGHMGEVVKVKEGYARNFLLPRGKALRRPAVWAAESRPLSNVATTWVGVAGLTIRRSLRTTRLALTK